MNDNMNTVELYRSSQDNSVWSYSFLNKSFNIMFCIPCQIFLVINMLYVLSMPNCDWEAPDGDVELLSMVYVT